MALLGYILHKREMRTLLTIYLFFPLKKVAHSYLHRGIPKREFERHKFTWYGGCTHTLG